MKLLLPFAALLIFSGCSLNTNAPTSNPPTEPIASEIISQINLYQVILQGSKSDYTGTQETIGCNDFLISFPVKSNIPENNKFAATRDLLTQYDSQRTGYLNPWKIQDSLSFYSYEIKEKTLTINLKGTIRLDGACDLPRLEETIKATYKQFGFDNIVVLLNNTTLSSVAGN